ncbi:hypothetical protein WDW89_25825 [Deltaproteobacteria bacterium TL4]
MTNREVLINEINHLPDFVIKQLLDIIHYIKIGVEYEYVSETSNEFYNSEEFQDVVSKSINEYRSGKTEDMDVFS